VYQLHSKALKQLLVYFQHQVMRLTMRGLLTQMEIFMSGMEQLGIALDKLLEQQDRKVLLDLQVLQEQQDLREQLDQLDLKDLWEQLDRLVPQETQETQD
jgi:predicted ABC-class ATPase